MASQSKYHRQKSQLRHLSNWALLSVFDSLGFTIAPLSIISGILYTIMMGCSIKYTRSEVLKSRMDALFYCSKDTIRYPPKLAQDRPGDCQPILCIYTIRHKISQQTPPSQSIMLTHILPHKVTSTVSYQKYAARGHYPQLARSQS